MNLGDIVKRILHPFVKGTKLETCDSCEKRRIWLNNFSTGVSGFFSRWIAKLTCPCWWKGWFYKK